MASCPNCGDRIAEALATAPMCVCPSCTTTVYQMDGRLLSAGNAGEMYDAPLLVQLGREVRIWDHWYLPVGHARFAYDTGWWDEFWAEDDNGAGYWISVDEGDVVVQSPMDHAPVAGVPKRLGAFISYGDGYRVTEIDEARCIALRGRFPEHLSVGDRYRYVNAMSENGALLSAEVHAGETTWFQGRWLDPFTLELAPRSHA